VASSIDARIVASSPKPFGSAFQERPAMPRVVVFGSSNTDMTVRLPHLPAPGQTVLGSSFSTTPGGKGANQAVAARRAGAQVVFITAVGDDALGRRALELYGREDIDVSHVRVVENVSSGVALIFVGDDGENMIGVASGANSQLMPADVDRLPASLFHKENVLLVSLEIPLETAVRALRRGAGAGMTTILNPAPAPSLSRSEATRLLSDATVVTPNRVEAQTLAGMDCDPAVEPDWKLWANGLRATGARTMVITLGSRGCLVLDATSDFVPAPAVKAVDTVGAGDAFNGALAVALAEGRTLREAAAWANAAGALAVTQPGAQLALPSRSAIDGLAKHTARVGTS
jgi:ribokinase